MFEPSSGRREAPRAAQGGAHVYKNKALAPWQPLFVSAALSFRLVLLATSLPEGGSYYSVDILTHASKIGVNLKIGETDYSQPILV